MSTGSQRMMADARARRKAPDGGLLGLLVLLCILFLCLLWRVRTGVCLPFSEGEVVDFDGVQELCFF